MPRLRSPKLSRAVTGEKERGDVTTNQAGEASLFVFFQNLTPSSLRMQHPAAILTVFTPLAAILTVIQIDAATFAQRMR